MLLTIALIGLFGLIALSSFATLADALVRGVNAYPRLKLAAEVSDPRKIRVSRIETIGTAALPACRGVSAARRPVVRQPKLPAYRLPLSAAA